MTDRESSSLDLEHVVERFAESERALRELESRIEELGKLEERTRTSTDSLEDSAAAVTEYAEEARQVTLDLADVADEAGELLKRAKDVLDGSQLQHIEEAVNEGHEELRGELSRQGEQLEDMNQSVDAVGATVAETGERLASELDRTTEIERLQGAVEDVEGSLKDQGSKLISEFQKRLASVDDSVAGAQKRTTWLLVAIILLETAVLALVALPGL